MKNNEHNDQQRLWFIAAVLIVGSILLISAQFLLSSDIRHDRQTIDDLQLIEDQLSQSDEIVDSIDELDLPEVTQQRAEERSYSVEFIQKESSRRYTYKICAEFQQDTEDEQEPYRYYQPYSDHTSGVDCFEREIYILNTPTPDR